MVILSKIIYRASIRKKNPNFKGHLSLDIKVIILGSVVLSSRHDQIDFEFHLNESTSPF